MPLIKIHTQKGKAKKVKQAIVDGVDWVFRFCRDAASAFARCASADKCCGSRRVNLNKLLVLLLIVGVLFVSCERKNKTTLQKSDAPKTNIGRILLTNAGVDGGSDIYIIDGDNAPSRLTFSENAGGPDWSPDGKLMIYEDGNDIYEMLMDGYYDDKQLLIKNGHNPAWSPDGRFIAFIGVAKQEKDQILLADSDGTNRIKLTDSSGLNRLPAWSPDSKKIAFVSSRDGNDEIYAMKFDGSGQTRLTDNPSCDSAPSWSPDGSKLVFMSARDSKAEEEDLQIYIMNYDGNSQLKLTKAGQNNQYPVWISELNKIYFSCDCYIFIIDPDGSNKHILRGYGCAGVGKFAWHR